MLPIYFVHFLNKAYNKIYPVDLECIFKKSRSNVSDV